MPCIKNKVKHLLTPGLLLALVILSTRCTYKSSAAPSDFDSVSLPRASCNTTLSEISSCSSTASLPKPSPVKMESINKPFYSNSSSSTPTEIIINNGGHYVQYNDNTYYIQYSSPSVSDSSSNALNNYEDTVLHKMYCLSENKTPTVVFEGPYCGNINIYNEHFYLGTDANDDSSIYALDMNGENPIQIGYGTIVAIDLELGYLIICKSNDTLYSIDLKHSSYPQKILTASGEFIKFEDSTIYFREVENDYSQRSKGSLKLYCMNTDGSHSRCLFDIDPDRDLTIRDQYYREIRTFQIVDDEIYFSHGYHQGTAEIFYDGRIMCMSKDGSNLRQILPNNEYPASTSADFRVTCSGQDKYILYHDPGELSNVYRFNLTNGKLTETDLPTIHLNQHFIIDNCAYAYLTNSDVITPLITESDYQTMVLNGMEIVSPSPFSRRLEPRIGPTFEYANIEVVGPYVFFKVVEREPTHSITSSKVYRKNLKTGALDLLYQY